MHLVSVWAAANRVVLAQTEVDAEGNEITAIPALLQMLEVSGCIVTIDAIGCQKSIVQLLRERDADYVLALKKNQARSLLNGKASSCVEKNHGRIEIRRCWATAASEFLNYMNADREWSQLQSLVMVECERRLPDHTSRDDYATRAHWGIENSVHWVRLP